MRKYYSDWPEHEELNWLHRKRRRHVAHVKLCPTYDCVDIVFRNEVKKIVKLLHGIKNHLRCFLPMAFCFLFLTKPR
jgi:hypothetical protein